jgi:amino acid adenylation domain-containing protein
MGQRIEIGDTARRILALSSEKREALNALLQRAGARAAAIPRRGRTQGVPLSFGQQRLWFLNEWEPGNPAYILPATFPLADPVDVDAVRRTLTEILRRQSALRTRFRMSDDGPVQDISPDATPEFWVVAAAEDELPRLLREEFRRPFDLARGPLFRAALFQSAGASVLVFVMHHIVADGWSVGLLSQEFNAIYTAYSRGLASPLPELPIEWIDYALWQRENLTDVVVREKLAYWKRQLAGAPVLAWPASRPRPPAPTYRGALEPFLIPAALRDRLQALSRVEGVTLYMLLLAAFNSLAHRYCGQDDVVIGAPIASRNRPETERLVGFFVNTLVLRTDLSGKPTFRECLARVRKVLVDALANQDVPFERLVQELTPDRDLSRNPFFQVTFQLFTGAQPGSPAGVAPAIEVDKGASAFDLAFNLWESAHGVEGRIEYSTDLFDRECIARMAGHYMVLLEAIAAEPDCPISELPLLTEAEREDILIRWNATAVTTEDARPVHQLVEEQAAARPHAPAVGEMTYAELDRYANRVARYLRTRSSGPESVVAVCLDRSPELVAVLLGVLKAGAAYLPIDPATPQERIDFMVRDAGAALLVTRASLAELPDAPGESPAAAVVPDTLAYIIYTSGSTGEPKGVEVPHRALRNLVDWHRRAHAVAQADRAMQVTSIGFDAAVWEIWPYLAAGAAIEIADDDTRAEPARLLEWLAERQITICFLPTPLAEAVLRLRLPAGLALRELLTGGDRLRSHPTAAVPFRFSNHYGPTENGVVATFAFLDPREDGSPTIGRPIDNNRVYILDRHMQPVPVGVPGEIWIGGASLARGYRNRPDLTAARFVRNPFDCAGSGRLYRTGDLARFRLNGNIEFLGRTDRQIKIRGFRIEPAEIEAALARCPGIREAFVTERDSRLVAYWVRDPRHAASDLRAQLAARLPDYMLPAALVELETLPVTAHGKIDERALPAPERTAAPDPDAQPRNAVEEVLAGIWAEVLQVETVGTCDDFFADLGGHSLLSVLLVSRIREALDIDLPLRALFECPTVRGLADRLLADPAQAGCVSKVAELLLRFVEMPDHELEAFAAGKDGSGR